MARKNDLLPLQQVAVLSRLHAVDKEVVLAAAVLFASRLGLRRADTLGRAKDGAEAGDECEHHCAGLFWLGGL